MKLIKKKNVFSSSSNNEIKCWFISSEMDSMQSIGDRYSLVPVVNYMQSREAWGKKVGT